MEGDTSFLHSSSAGFFFVTPCAASCCKSASCSSTCIHIYIYIGTCGSDVKIRCILAAVEASNFHVQPCVAHIHTRCRISNPSIHRVLLSITHPHYVLHMYDITRIISPCYPATDGEGKGGDGAVAVRRELGACSKGFWSLAPAGTGYPRLTVRKTSRGFAFPDMPLRVHIIESPDN